MSEMNNFKIEMVKLKFFFFVQLFMYVTRCRFIDVQRDFGQVRGEFAQCPQTQSGRFRRRNALPGKSIKLNLLKLSCGMVLTCND